MTPEQVEKTARVLLGHMKALKSVSDRCQNINTMGGEEEAWAECDREAAQQQSIMNHVGGVITAAVGHQWYQVCQMVAHGLWRD